MSFTVFRPDELMWAGLNLRSKQPAEHTICYSLILLIKKIHIVIEFLFSLSFSTSCCLSVTMLLLLLQHSIMEA